MILMVKGSSYVFKTFSGRISVLRRAFSSTDIIIENGIAVTRGGRTIVCYHPEPAFPYECSLPLPDQAPMSDNSVFKVQAITALKSIHRPKNDELKRQELMNITHTTKHVWFPCNRKYKEKKTDMDRPYL